MDQKANEHGDLTITKEQKEKAESFLAEEDAPTHRLFGKIGTFITVTAVIMTLVHLYAAIWIVPTQFLRWIHVMFVLFLIFLVYPAVRQKKNKPQWYDYSLSIVTVSIFAYSFIDFEEIIYRAVLPTQWDQICGLVLIGLVIEAIRRTSGWILPAIIIAFLGYAYLGPWLPEPWAHRGYGVDRLVGHMYITLDGIFGMPVDVSSSYIILFTTYGAFLEFSGAGKFFIDFSLAATGGKPTGAGRTVTLASFLLGGPSGSGVATTVTLGSVAWPMLAKAGYSKEAAGGLLAAGGIGAILSPPILGAAAFLIAEFLKISYFDVILMACIPTILYYWAILLMVEFDAKKFGATSISYEGKYSLKKLTILYGYHFFSLIAIVIFMVIGMSPIMAVVWATLITFAFSFIRSDTSLTPLKLVKALRGGSIGILFVGSVCASAGIIIGVVTLTGLGLNFSNIVIKYAGGSLFLTAVFTALIVWVVGLAVPVAASYVICAVIAAPALIKLGVPDYAAHMFIFYYALLSEVTPPTAASPFAAAALTGGNPYKTTMQAWKYTLPAFLVPFNFTLSPDGVALLLKGEPVTIFFTFITAFIGVFALAAGLDGWVFKKASTVERILLIISGLMLVYASLIFDVIGLGLVALVILMQKGVIHFAKSHP